MRCLTLFFGVRRNLFVPAKLKFIIMIVLIMVH